MMQLPDTNRSVHTHTHCACIPRMEHTYPTCCMANSIYPICNLGKVFFSSSSQVMKYNDDCVEKDTSPPFCEINADLMTVTIFIFLMEIGMRFYHTGSMEGSNRKMAFLFVGWCFFCFAVLVVVVCF